LLYFSKKGNIGSLLILNYAIKKNDPHLTEDLVALKMINDLTQCTSNKMIRGMIYFKDMMQTTSTPPKKRARRHNKTHEKNDCISWWPGKNKSI
jgi:hypothetical protein